MKVSPPNNAVIALALIVLLVGAIWRFDPDDSSLNSGNDTDPGSASIPVANDGYPTPSEAKSAVPLGTPDLKAAGGKPYGFMFTQVNSTEPVTYDPCRPIQVVVNKRTAPKDGDRMLSESLQRITTETGLQFVIEGETAEEPSVDRASFQKDRYGDRWAPVLVAWSDPKEYPDLKGDVAGIGGSEYTQPGDDGARTYISGELYLDGPQLEEIDDDEGEASARATVMHELGHLVGLDHVNDKTQIMNPEGSSEVTEFGKGDKAGLVALGQGACQKEL